MNRLALLLSLAMLVGCYPSRPPARAAAPEPYVSGQTQRLPRIPLGAFPANALTGLAQDVTATGPGTANATVTQAQIGHQQFDTNGAIRGSLHVSSPVTGYELGTGSCSPGSTDTTLALGVDVANQGAGCSGASYTVLARTNDGSVHINAQTNNATAATPVLYLEVLGTPGLQLVGQGTGSVSSHLMVGGVGGVTTNLVLGSIGTIPPSDSGMKGGVIWESATTEPTCTTGIQSMAWVKSGTGDLYFCNGGTGTKYQLDSLGLVPGANNTFLQSVSGSLAWSLMSGDGSLVAGALTIASANAGTVGFGGSSTTISSTGDVRHANATILDSFRNAANSANLAAISSDSSNDVVLAGNGTASVIQKPGGVVTETCATSGTCSFAGGIATATATKTASYTVDSGAATDYEIRTNCSSACTITGSSALSSTSGRTLSLVDVGANADSNPVTFTPASGTINGLSAYVFSARGYAVTITSDGTNLWVH